MSKNIGSCSVIIPSRQAGKTLFATVDSTLLQDGLSELIVVNSGNAPDIISRLQQMAISDPRIKIISVNGNLSHTAGCNVGAKNATSEYILFLKPDYLLPPDTIKLFIAALNNEAKTMLVSGEICNSDSTPAHLFRDKIITPSSFAKEIIGLAKPAFITTSENKKPFEVTNVSNACFCIRASDYKKIGGIDEAFFDNGEYIDLCLRIEQIGWRVLCVPSVMIAKLPTATTTRDNWLASWQEAKSSIRYFNKFFAEHHSAGLLLCLNILLIIRATIKAIFSGKTRKPAVKTNPDKQLMTLANGAMNIAKTKELNKKIVLVTGASSGIGLCVIRHLIASGAAVIAISRDCKIPYEHPHLRWLKKDLSSAKFDLDGYCVDAVIHCAPLWLLPPIIKTISEAEATRIIAFSSTDIFVKMLAGNDLQNELKLKLEHAEKSIAENCTSSNIKYTIFRPTATYGVGLDYGITRIANKIQKSRMFLIYPPAKGSRQPVHADDLAIACLKAINNQNSFDKSYNLSGADIISYRDMIVKIFETLGIRQQIIKTTALPFLYEIIGKLRRNKQINAENARRMNDDYAFFHEDAKRDFGFSPRKFLAGGAEDIDGF